MMRLSSPVRAVSLGALGLLTMALAATACGGSTRDTTFDDDATSSSGAVGSSGGGGTSSGGIGGNSSGGTSSGGSSAGCSDAAKLVYVLSSDYDLYSFDPAALKFTKIGALDCPVQETEVSVDDGFGGQQDLGPNTPNSMAVDRTGVAWVGYSNGELFKVNTTDASCTKTSFDFEHQDFNKYGMGFSADAAGSTSETLYLIGQVVGSDGFEITTTGKGLYKLDTSSLEATAINDFDGSFEGVTGELTGGGDGTLYGFFTTSPAKSGEIDKTTAKVTNVKSLDTVDLGGGAYAFAFSYWGGDFWFYTGTDGDPSKVTRLHTATDGSEETVKTDVGGFEIVGAGVSTCAPTTPVN